MATKDWEVGASPSMELVFMPITRSIDLRVRSWMPPTSLFFSWDLQGVVLGVGLEHETLTLNWVGKGEIVAAALLLARLRLYVNVLLLLLRMCRAAL